MRYNDITAEFLSKADKIYEFMVTAELDGEEYLPEEIHEMGMFQLKSLEFFNGEKTFEMNPKAIEAFNQSLDDYKKNRIWITIYKDILGIDDWDNLTSICIPKDWLETKLRANGETLDEWLNEYTADDTDSLARDALIENMVRDYEKKDLRELYKIKAQNNQENTKDKENNLQEKITAAHNRFGDLNKDALESEQVWKVTFFHVTPEPQKHEFDVYVNMIPKDLHDGRREFFLDYDKQQEAFEKAAAIIGKDVFSEYVIMNAEIVEKPKQNLKEEKTKETDREI